MWPLDYYWQVEWVPSNEQDVPDPGTSYIVRIDLRERSQVTAGCSSGAEDSSAWMQYGRSWWGYRDAGASYPSPLYVANPTRPFFQRINDPLFGTVAFSWDAQTGKWLGLVHCSVLASLDFTGASPIEPRNMVGGTLSANYDAKVHQIDGITVSPRF